MTKARENNPFNAYEPPIELERYLKDGCCPVCEEGLLPGSRDPDTFEFLKEDRCLLCGQRVIYGETP